MLTRRLLMPLIFMAVICATTVTASAKSWEKVDSTTIGRKMDHGTIFNPHLNSVRYRMIKLTLSKSPVRFLRVVVTYGNDEHVQISLNDLVPAEGSTQDLTLPRIGYVKRVDFWYDPASLEKTTSVTLFAYPV